MTKQRIRRNRTLFDHYNMNVLQEYTFGRINNTYIKVEQKGGE